YLQYKVFFIKVNIQKNNTNIRHIKNDIYQTSKQMQSSTDFVTKSINLLAEVVDYVNYKKSPSLIRITNFSKL
uniref:Uncharacterized protein n=1 Tax=Megaselia scalaris TaxID=36166 RepID=T1GKQ7_MEGSC